MSTSLSPLLAPMLSAASMRAVCDDRASLQNMLDFEAALARAEAAAGVIPQAAAAAIAAACHAESFDLAALAEAATRSGNLAIPLVKALTASVAKADPEAARYVHWGATSQDVIDTAGMLTLRAGIDALLVDIDRAIAGFARLARQHRHTAMVARTWLQHALPMPFGLKLAEYAAALHRSRKRLRRLHEETLALQFGGAVTQSAWMLDGLASQLTQVPIFAGTAVADLRRLLLSVTLRQLVPGEELCREGEFHERLYVVLSGSVEQTSLAGPAGRVIFGSTVPLTDGSFGSCRRRWWRNYRRGVRVGRRSWKAERESKVSG